MGIVKIVGGVYLVDGAAKAVLVSSVLYEYKKNNIGYTQRNLCK